jgi:hypothetical protein
MKYLPSLLLGTALFLGTTGCESDNSAKGNVAMKCSMCECTNCEADPASPKMCKMCGHKLSDHHPADAEPSHHH